MIKQGRFMMVKKAVSAIILSFIFFNVSIGQTDTTSERISDFVSYPFINFYADTLITEYDSSLLTHFFNKWDKIVKTKEGNLNIIHIGGSHVQAGTFPHTIRQQILIKNPDLIGERGLIFPYSAAPKSNNPIDYRVRSIGSFSIVRNVFTPHEVPLGLTGVAVITEDTLAELRIIFTDSLLKFETEELILMGYSDSSYIVPTIWIDSLEYFPTKIDTIKKRFYYESLHFTDSFTVRFNCSQGERFITNGFYLKNSKPGITYHSIGVNGAALPSFLRCENFEQDLDLIYPDLVIMGIGVNDASGPNFDPEEFKNNYLVLIEKFQKVNPECAFIFVTNNDTYKRVRRKRKVYWTNNINGKKVQQVMYELASITQGAVFDQYHIMGGAKSMYQWMQKGLAQRDRVHFTRKGYQLMGMLFHDALMESKIRLDNYNTNKDNSEL